MTIIDLFYKSVEQIHHNLHGILLISKSMKGRDPSDSGEVKIKHNTNVY
jgi:hypothetical protein